VKAALFPTAERHAAPVLWGALVAVALAQPLSVLVGTAGIFAAAAVPFGFGIFLERIGGE